MKARRGGSITQPVPMRVLHVVPNLELGGAPRGAIEIALELKRRGRFEATFCVMGSPPVEARRELELLRVYFLRCTASPRRAILGRLLALDSVLGEVDPDLIHTHLWPASATAAIISRARHIPLIVHIRDTPERFAQRDLRAVVRRQWYRWLFGSSLVTFIAVSEAAADYTARLLGIRKDRIRVVLNGVDASRLGSSSPAKVMPSPGSRRIWVGAVGRFVPEKGHRYLLEAIEALRRRGMDVGLRLVGNGSLLPAYNEYVVANKLQDRIVIQGPTEAMAQFYQAIDIFALPSLSSEGLSRALLEAMATSLPIIATPCAGSAEVIRDGEEGLIVPIRDTEALAAAIEKLCGDAGLSQALASRARVRYLASHTIGSVVDQVERVYEERLLPAALEATRAQ